MSIFKKRSKPIYCTFLHNQTVYRVIHSKLIHNWRSNYEISQSFVVVYIFWYHQWKYWDCIVSSYASSRPL